MRFAGIWGFCLWALLPAAAFWPANMAAGQNAGAEQAYGGKPMLLPADKAPLIFAAGENKRAFTVEIARTMEEGERGLMFRRIFPQDRAMLFVFAGAPRVRMMWMENTPLPLDIVFADQSGKILSVYARAKPFSRDLISSLYPAAYAVELNAGKAAGIKPGQFIRHPAICGACGGKDGEAGE